MKNYLEIFLLKEYMYLNRLSCMIDQVRKYPMSIIIEPI